MEWYSYDGAFESVSFNDLVLWSVPVVIITSNRSMYDL